MRRACCLALLCWVLLAGAQPPPAAMALSRGQAAQAAGDYPRAEACFRAAIAEAAGLPVEDPGAAEPYLALAELYAAWKKPDDMGAALQELTARLGGGAQGAARAGSCLLALAERVRNTWRYDLAQVLYQHALRLSEEGYGVEDARLLPVLAALADLYQVNGFQKEKAEMLWQRAIGIAERDGGQADIRIATYLLHLAVLHQYWPERIECVEAELLRAQAIRERAVGKDDPGVAEVLLPLARHYCHSDVRRYRDGEALYRRVLTIQEGAFGAEDERLVPALRLLAQLYERDFGDAKAAERLRLRVMAIYAKAYGETDWRVGDARMAVAALYLAQGRPAEAEDHLRKALATRPRVDEPTGWSNAVLLYWLARACHRQHKLADAEGFYQRAVAVTDQLFAEGHYEPTLIPYVYEDAMTCLREAGKPAGADAIAERAAVCARRVWKEGVARLLFNADWQQAHPDRHGNWQVSAESYFRLALLLQSRKQLPNDPDLAEIRRRYAAFLTRVGRAVEAQAMASDR